MIHFTKSGANGPVTAVEPHAIPALLRDMFAADPQLYLDAAVVHARRMAARP